LPCLAWLAAPLQISVPVIHHITFADGSAHDDIVLTSGTRRAALPCLDACLTCLQRAWAVCSGVQGRLFPRLQLLRCGCSPTQRPSLPPPRLPHLQAA
jgi:hypothetical protein